jgi:hypothetical protein
MSEQSGKGKLGWHAGKHVIAVLLAVRKHS